MENIKALKIAARTALNIVLNLQSAPHTTTKQLAIAQAEYERCALAYDAAMLAECGDVPDEAVR